MQLNEQVHGDVVVLTPSGVTIGDEEIDKLRDRIRGLIGEGFLKVVLDLEKTRWINSAGLGSMIASLTSLTNKGGDLRLAKISDRIQSLFLITQLVKVFKTFETVDRAVASYLIDPISGVPVDQGSA
jgi:anti-sigma B factor antagonist